MARFSGATWRGEVPNRTPGAMRHPALGVVLHIMEGTLNGTDSWFKNPTAQASSHFGVGKDGQTYQWVDTDDASWAQAGGNKSYISIENEGHHGDTLTDAQIAACAKIVAWVHETEGMPLQLADTPGTAGLGFHAMGGAAWGGHTSCPGDLIVGQRARVLAAISKGAPTVPPMYDPALGPVAAAASWPDGGALLLSPSGAVFAILGAPYQGGANGQAYFEGRTAATFNTDANHVAIKNAKGGYSIIATSGERYDFPH